MVQPRLPFIPPGMSVTPWTPFHGVTGVPAAFTIPGVGRAGRKTEREPAVQEVGTEDGGLNLSHQLFQVQFPDPFHSSDFRPPSSSRIEPDDHSRPDTRSRP